MDMNWRRDGGSMGWLLGRLEMRGGRGRGGGIEKVIDF